MKIPTPTSKSRNWRVIVLLFFLVWVMMMAGRMILTPVQGVLAQDYHLSNAQIGLLTSVFLIAYVLVQIPSGILGDKFGRVFLVTASLVLTGVFTGLTGLSGTLVILLVMRALSGVAQGLLFGPQFAVTSELIPLRHRTVSVAIINSGQAVGITVGLIGSSYLAFTLDGGWSMPFYVFAVPTILVGALIWFLVPEPERTHTLGTKPIQWKEIGQLVVKRNMIISFVASFCGLYVFIMLLTWLPTYLEVDEGVPRQETGLLSSYMVWLSVPASILVGYLADRIRQRRIMLMVMYGLSILSMIALLVFHNYAGMLFALVMYGLFGKIATDPLLIGLVGENVARHQLSTAFGVFNFIANCSAAIAPLLTGYLQDLTGSWTMAFSVSIVMLMIAMGACYFIEERHPGDS